MLRPIRHLHRAIHEQAPNKYDEIQRTEDHEWCRRADRIEYDAAAFGADQDTHRASNSEESENRAPMIGVCLLSAQSLAADKGRDLVIRSSVDESRTIQDVLVGDVWIITGSRQLDGQLVRPTNVGLR